MPSMSLWSVEKTNKKAIMLQYKKYNTRRKHIQCYEDRVPPKFLVQLIE